MTLFRLIIRNIHHYRNSWLLTLAGAIIGTAVLTGALITGDSVKYSLAEMVRMRLGSARYALAPPDRFFRQALASQMESASGHATVPVMRTQGIVTEPEQNLTLNRAEITGVPPGFFRLWPMEKGSSEVPEPLSGEAVISSNVAEKLGVDAGDFIVVKISTEGFAPANAPFVSEQATTSGMRLKIKAIAGNRSGGRFSLSSNQSAPFNIFVPLELLSAKMGMKGFANTLLIDPKNNPGNIDTLSRSLQQSLTPEDAGLVLSQPQPGIFQIDSRRIFIEDPLAAVIKKSIPTAQGILTYLVNDLVFNSKSTPYSFVTAAEPSVSMTEPGPGGIVINEWLATDLGARTGDSVTLKYWVMGANRTLTEVSAAFKVTAVEPVVQSESLRRLMPDFPGMKNTGSCRDWETGTPVDLKRIRDKDEAYWNVWKGTPKAFISLADGQKLWQNPFGSYSAFRFYDSTAYKVLCTGIREMNPAITGLSFTAVYDEGLRAAGNSTDFGELFLSLGGLIVIAGLMLSGMLFSLFLRQRVEEMTLMRALGFRNRRIMAVFLTESLIVSVAGGIPGILLAVGYARLILSGLNTLWQDAVNTSSLIIDVRDASLMAGFLAGFLLNTGVFLLVIYRNRRRSLPSAFLQPAPPRINRRGLLKNIGIILSVALFLAAIIIMMLEFQSGRFYPSVTFMITGILILTGMILGAGVFLSRRRFTELGLHAGVVGHAFRSAGLNRNRSIVAIALVALGTFTILVTGLNRKAKSSDQFLPASCTGGFRLWLESTLPITADLNSAEGKRKAGLEDEPLTAQMLFFPLPDVAGDDASCLNLNQVARPGLKGVPSGMFDTRQAFTFVNLVPGIDKEHPWRGLEKTDHPGCINGFADQTVITWGLRMKTGDTLHFLDESGNPLHIRLAGSLANSVFQGSILVSENLLRRHFPASARVRNFLISVPETGEKEAVNILENRLRDQGAVVRATTDRLAAFDAVENTYLDVFVMLGGLGLIIGTAGLAVMVARNLRDRQRELSLYAALGFPSGLIYRLLATEFFFILFTGMAAGMVAALAGTLPSVLGSSIGSLAFPAVLMIIVLSNGFLWIHFPVVRRIKSMIRQSSGKFL